MPLLYNSTVSLMGVIMHSSTDEFRLRARSGDHLREFLYDRNGVPQLINQNEDRRRWLHKALDEWIDQNMAEIAE